MTDELHLVERFIDRHRYGLVELLTNDDGGVSQLRLDGDARLGRSRWGVLDRRVPGVGDDDGLLDGADLLILGDLDRVAAVILLAVACAAQTLGQLAHGDVEGGEAVGGTGLGPDDRAFRDDGDLGALGGIGLARVALVGDLDLDALDARVELLDLGGLLLDVVPQTRTDLSVAADDGDVHGEPFWVLMILQGDRALESTRRTVRRALDGRSPPPECQPAGRAGRRAVACVAARASVHGDT